MMDVMYKFQTPSGVQYGYFSAEYLDDEDKRAETMQTMIEDARYLTNALRRTGDDPTEVGQKKVENGHTYKAVQNEATKELYWLIETV
jgi:hypothetical protein